MLFLGIEPMELPTVIIAMFSDPGGNIIGLLKE